MGKLGPTAACLLAAALFGASTPAAKALLAPMGPLALAGLLYLGAAAGTLPWALRDSLRPARADRRNWWLLAGAVVFGGGLGPALLMLGLAAAPAASVALWLNLETVATTVLAWALFREHVQWRTWLASGLVCLASVLLTTPAAALLAPAAGLVALACVCWGLDNCLTALVDRFTPAQTTFAKGLVAGATNLALGLGLAGAVPGAQAVGWAMLVGAFSYGWSIVLYIAGAQQLGAARSQLIFASAPFWGVLIAWSALGEPPLPMQLVAAAIMLGALWLMQTERHAHAHGHDRLRHTHAHRHDDGHHTHAHPGLPASTRHTHEHVHEPQRHTHPHQPDLHHRHEHA